jgi:hypothetical protein
VLDDFCGPHALPERDAGETHLRAEVLSYNLRGLGVEAVAHGQLGSIVVASDDVPASRQSQSGERDVVVEGRVHL